MEEKNEQVEVNTEVVEETATVKTTETATEEVEKTAKPKRGRSNRNTNLEKLYTK